MAHLSHLLTTAVEAVFAAAAAAADIGKKCSTSRLTRAIALSDSLLPPELFDLLPRNRNQKVENTIAQTEAFL